MNYSEMIDKATLLKEIKDMQSKKKELILYGRKKIVEIETEIKKLEFEKEKSILNELKKSSFNLFGKKQLSKEELSKKIKESKLLIENELKTIETLEKATIKDQFNLNDVMKQLDNIRAEVISEIGATEVKVSDSQQKYFDLNREYQEQLMIANQFVNYANKVVASVNLEGLTYANGTYWNNKQERVSVEQLGIYPFSKSASLIEAQLKFNQKEIEYNGKN